MHFCQGQTYELNKFWKATTQNKQLINLEYSDNLVLNLPIN